MCIRDRSRSICTFSESPRHDAVAVCAHLEPDVAQVKLNVPNIRKIHFMSDGPSTQYRNKNLFYLAATFFLNKLQVSSLHWHFSERGHGKGAPDGVGGCVKRVADSLVAQGTDIPDLKTLVDEIGRHVPNVEIFEINTSNIDEIQNLLPENIITFKGTLKIHEITWSAETIHLIHARRLSCMECEANQICNHYSIGQIQVPDQTRILLFVHNNILNYLNNLNFSPVM